MKYEIYEMIEPEILSETKPSGYDMETTNGIVLQRPKYSTNLDNFYNSEKEAYDAIVENKGKIKTRKFCILPVVNVGFDGEIY